MRRIDTKDPRAIWNAYEKAQGYNSAINLYATVETNEDFYAGDQWKGVNAPDIDKPVLNIVTQPVNYMVSNIVSDDVAISISPALPNEEDERYLKGVKTEIDRIREQNRIETFNRELMRNCAVDGDGCGYLYWDADIKTGQAQRGDVAMMLINNTNCLFGNPVDPNPQNQPHIILVTRRYIDEVIDEAIENGMNEDEAVDKIKPELRPEFGEQNVDEILVTRLMYFYKDPKTKTIHYVIAVKDAIIKEDTDTKLELYPIAWMNWQRRRGSYHGTSVAQSIIPNQIMINKMLAAKDRALLLMAFPKIIYNKAVIGKWNNTIGENIGIDGAVDRVFAQVLPGAETSMQVTQHIESLVAHTKESIGANDAAMGQMSSDNTSAIIALQEANTVPLNLQRQAFYDFQEQITRIMLDILRVEAGTRYVPIDDEEKELMEEAAQMQAQTTGNAELDTNAVMMGETALPSKLYDPVMDTIDSIGTANDISNAPDGTHPIDFSRLADMAMQLDVKVGTGSMWSEVTQERTMENLFKNGIIDGMDMLEEMPQRFVPNKATLLKRYKKRLQQQAQEQAQYPAANGDFIDTSGRTGESLSTDTAKEYIQELEPTI